MNDVADIPMTEAEEAAEREAGLQWEREHRTFILGCKIGITTWLTAVTAGVGLAAAQLRPPGPDWLRWVFGAAVAWVLSAFIWCPWADDGEVPHDAA